MPHHHGAVIFGTRPEAIKLAPLVSALRRSSSVEVLCISTQQHESLLSDALEATDLVVDVQTSPPDRTDLNSLTASVTHALGRVAADSDLVVVQGDTLSAFAGALHGFLWKVPVAHVEAGLRTSSLHLPHPEEGLRRAIAQFTGLHLAPTQRARRNLEREGVNSSSIVVVGNTSVDAITRQLANDDVRSVPPVVVEGPYCVLTVHRRETWGAPMENIAQAMWTLANGFPHITFVCPLHPNPIVRSAFAKLEPLPNLLVVDPIPHDEFVGLLANSLLILTDSGGIQEEATVLRVPVVILREETERPEVAEVGVGVLAGTATERVLDAARLLIQERLADTWSCPLNSPFGDGNAGVRAAVAIEAFLAGEALPGDFKPR